MAVDAAREVNGVIESLSEQQIEHLSSLPDGFFPARGNHRKEHIEQIETVL